MEKETIKILDIIKDKEYSCGYCRECSEIEDKIDRIIKRMR